jgi:hypothetical protein
MDFAKLVESVSDAFSCDWDMGTEQNERLSLEIVAIFSVLSSVSRDTRADILARYIDDRMSLDTDEKQFEELVDAVLRHLIHD